jgi:hypothetical protein
VNAPVLDRKTSKAWLIFGVLAVGVLVGIWLTAVLSKTHQPVHKGKTVTAWIEEMYANQNDATARYELIEMGNSAIPYLIREARNDGGVPGRFYGWLWSKLPAGMQKHLPALPNYPARRAAAADALNGFGPAASNAVPALVGCLQTKGYQPLRFSAAVTLGSIGPSASNGVPALVQALKDQDFNVRMEAAFALAKIGSGYSQATPQLEGLLNDRVSGVRLRAALALWRLQPNETTASNRVARFLLKDPDSSVRIWASFLIGDLGPAARVLSPALQDALGDPDSRVQQNATFSLKKLKPTVEMNQEDPTSSH